MAVDPERTGLCPNCGAQVLEGQRFCRVCGTDVTASSYAPPESPALTLPEAPPPSAAVTPPVATVPMARGAGPRWPAWLGVVTSVLVAVATGLEWIAAGPFSADGFDVLFASLYSDSATGGMPIAAVLLAIVGLGLAAAALIAGDARRLSITFIAAGAASAVFVLWYVGRAMSGESVPGTTTTSYGVWLAVVGAIGTIVSGLLLLAARPRLA